MQATGGSLDRSRASSAQGSSSAAIRIAPLKKTAIRRLNFLSVHRSEVPSMISMSKALAPRTVRVLVACIALISCMCAPPACAKSAHVLIIVPPGATTPVEFAQQLAAWRQSGEVSSALLLDEGEETEPGLVSLALLELPSEGCDVNWERHEVSEVSAPLVERAAVVLTWRALH